MGLKLITEGIGRRLIALAELAYDNRVHPVGELELWVLPLTEADEGRPRLIMVVEMPGGHVVTLETTVQLFRELCRELGEVH